MTFFVFFAFELVEFSFSRSTRWRERGDIHRRTRKSMLSPRRHVVGAAIIFALTLAAQPSDAFVAPSNHAVSYLPWALGTKERMVLEIGHHPPSFRRLVVVGSASMGASSSGNSEDDSISISSQQCRTMPGQPRETLSLEIFEHLTASGYPSKEALRLISCKLATPAWIGIRVNTLRASPSAVMEELRELCRCLYGPEFAAGVVAAHQAVPESILVPARFTHREAALRQRARGLPRVVVGRLCGEAVLQGADVYAAGVGSLPPGMGLGDEVRCIEILLSTMGLSVCSCLPCFALVHRRPSALA